MVVTHPLSLLAFSSSLPGDLNSEIPGHKPAPLVYCLLQNLINSSPVQKQNKIDATQ